jgi:hypothetical protein
MIDFDARSISADAICADRYHFQSLWTLGDTVSPAPFRKHDRTLMLAAYRDLMPPIMREADEEAGANALAAAFGDYWTEWGRRNDWVAPTVVRNDPPSPELSVDVPRAVREEEMRFELTKDLIARGTPVDDILRAVRSLMKMIRGHDATER